MATLTMLRNAHLSDTTSINENEELKDRESSPQKKQLEGSRKSNGSVKHRLDDENADMNGGGGGGGGVDSSSLASSSSSSSTTSSTSTTSTTSNRRKLKPNSSSLLRSNSNSSISSNSSVSSSSSSSSRKGGLPTRSQYAMILVLSPLNGTFERKSLIVPFAPDVLKLGRQTNAKTTPGPDNGYFDSRVLSRQHAELWADKLTGKVWIKDAKSSNGTYINKQRLSSDNTESEPYELKKNDILELGIDICGDDGLTLVHRKISAKVERVCIISLQANESGTGGIINNTNNHNSNINNSNINNNINNNNIKHLNGKVLLMNGGGVGSEPNSSPNATNNNQTGTKTSNLNGSTVLRSRSDVNGTKIRRMGMTAGIEANKTTDPLDVTLFGDMDDSLEDLVLGHTRNSVGGLFMHNGLNSSLAFEATIKKLIGEIHSIKLEGAKLKSINRVLQDIKIKQDKNNQLSSLSIPDEIVAKNAYINELESRLQDQTLLDKLLADEQSKRKVLEKENKLLMEKAAKVVIDTTTTTELPISTTTNTTTPPRNASSPNSNNTRIESLTSELSSTIKQLNSFKLRSKNAEELVEQQKLTIEELKKSLEEVQSQLKAKSYPTHSPRYSPLLQPSSPSSPPSILQLHQAPFDTLSPSLQIAISTGNSSPIATNSSSPTNSLTPTTPTSPTTTAPPTPPLTRLQTGSKPKPTSPSSTTKTIPMTTALGVVVLGISLMSFLNRLSRDR